MDFRFTQKHCDVINHFTERCLAIICETHPHLEKFLFIGTKFRSDLIKRIGWSPSFTFPEFQVNPFQASFINVDDGVMVASEEKASSSSRRSITTIKPKTSEPSHCWSRINSTTSTALVAQRNNCAPHRGQRQATSLQRSIHSAQLSKEPLHSVMSMQSINMK